LLKSRDGEEITCEGKLFQIHASATGKPGTNGRKSDGKNKRHNRLTGLTE